MAKALSWGMEPKMGSKINLLTLQAIDNVLLFIHHQKIEADSFLKGETNLVKKIEEAQYNPQEVVYTAAKSIIEKWTQSQESALL